ncbi:MAG: ABC transporter ATP-binding protein [Candidatus Shapirobacteria bacterium]|jgi:ATP-binding cassette subfamily B protein
MAKTFVKFYQFIFRYKTSFLVFIVTLVASGILENLSPYILKLLIDNASKGNFEVLFGLLLGLVGMRITSNFIDALSIYLGDKIQIPAARDARIAVFKKIQDLDFAFHVNKNTGSLISAFKRGDGAFFNLFQNFHHEVLKTIVSLGVVLFFFSKINSVILVVMLGLFVINVAVMSLLIKFNLKTRKEFNDSEDRISGIITDNLINYETVKFFAQEDQEENRLRTEFKDWFIKMWRFSNSFRLMDISIGTISNLGLFVILAVMVRMLTKQQIGLGDFVMVSSFVSGFYYRFFGLFFQFRNIAKSFIDLGKYFDILDDDIIVKDPGVSKKIELVRGKIELEDAEFSYPGNKKKVLGKINLLIEPGQSVAFVGRSGAGKTTLVKLILRFYDLTSGKIMLDGIDIRDMDKSYLRSFMGVVPQEPVLFNNTIGFNIGYGNKDVGLGSIKAAAKLANLDKFIEELPEKYETQVGERGIKLSGGQKQRLAIARAMLINPKVLIFDEATSNLDSESEGLVQDALWKTAANRTVLIIAHRFSTIRRADKIIVMDKGKIAETGTHQELLEIDNGIYRKLWELQARGKLEQESGGLMTPN